MSEGDEILIVARDWVKKANDLKNAVHTLEMGDDCPTDTVCFHAQQCVEKYVKVFLRREKSVHPWVLGGSRHSMPRMVRSRAILKVEENSSTGFSSSSKTVACP